jgi:8-oxo-dGTP diphosphatase
MNLSPSVAPLVADAGVAREGHATRTLVEVAVGVLIRPNGDFLLTSRPTGKVYAGFWEFPGGKLEPGESALQALQRELREELGIDIGPATLWKRLKVDYPHALVQLNFYQVFDWRGELQMREAQSFAWQCLPVQVRPVLAGTVPVLQWLAAQRGFLDATHSVAARAGA